MIELACFLKTLPPSRLDLSGYPRTESHRLTDVRKPAINSPGHYREYELAQKLAPLNDPRMHFWFQNNGIPGVNDIDIVIYHEEHGIFAIEVKGVRLTEIAYLSFRECQIDGRDENTNPNIKAGNASQKLQQYLRPRVGILARDLGGITPAACWPIIERRLWNEHWDNEELTGDYARRMIFKEDVETGASSFNFRLSQIAQNPLFNSYRSPFRHSKDLLEAIHKALDPVARPLPAPSDIQRLMTIERSVAAEATREAPVGRGTRLFYSGLPGTGKTFRLLQIGYAHALAKQRTLYVCFNKVLASDIRRLLNLSNVLSEPDLVFDVYDYFDVLRANAGGQLLTGEQEGEDDYDEWAQLVVDDLSTVRPQKYDTILVDEAQDLPGWAFDLIDLLRKPHSTICVAYGSGQQLYGSNTNDETEAKADHSARGQAWLSAFSASASLKPRLSRTFETLSLYSN